MRKTRPDTQQERFRETLPLGSPRRGKAFAVITAVGFVLLWRTIGGSHSDALIVALVGGVMVTIVLLITHSRLRTVVYHDSLVIELLGLGESRSLRPGELRGAVAGTFNPMTDDDGWGALRSVSPMLALRRSRKGVWLQRNGAEALFVPSECPEELAQAVENLFR